MKKLIYIFFIIINISMFSKNLYYFDESWNRLENKENALYYREIEDVKSQYGYKFFDYFISGELQNEGYLIDLDNDNSLNGISKWYDKNGNLTEESYFDSGKREGLSKFYKNNQLKLEVNFKDNKKDGLEQEYSNNNVIRKSYYKDDKLDGKSELFDEKGQLIEEEMFKDNKKNGDFTIFDAGTKLIEGHYLEDEKEGEWNYYNIKGVVKFKEKYEHDELKQITTYYDDGLLESTVVTLENNTQMLNFYSKKGYKMLDGKLHNSKPVGKWNLYNNKGEILETMTKY